MQAIKKLFYTYRNGVVAESLRRYGIPHKVIFGLQVPQVQQIAQQLTFDTSAACREMADRLWEDREVRESRMLACYLFDPASIHLDEALALACDTRTQEEADMLAFRLLKRMPQAVELLKRLDAHAVGENPEAESARRSASSLRNHLS